MRIGYVLEQFPKLSETFILEEMLELERLGLELTIFALSDLKESQIHEKVGLLEARVVKLDVAARLWRACFGRAMGPQLRIILNVGLKKWLWGMGISSWLASEAKKRRITHLHAHFAGDAAWIAMLASKLSKIPYSFTVHAGGIFGWPYLIKEKIAGAKFVVSISEFNKRYLANEYDLSDDEIAKIKVIHCGVDLSMNQRVSASASQCPKILTVARLEEKKGHKCLLEALKILKDTKLNFQAIIAGGGILEESLKEQAQLLGMEDSVTFSGPLVQGEVQKLLKEADAFVLPCVKAKNGNMDGIPVSLMEAMAAGVPVVSTKLSGIPELIEDGRSGLLVEPQDSSKLASAIEKVLTDSELRSQVVGQARAKIEAEFDVVKNAKELKKLLLR